MKRVYVEKFVKKHAKDSPEQILQGLRKTAIAVTSEIMQESRLELNRLKAAKNILDVTEPIKTEITGNLTLNVVDYAKALKPKAKAESH